MPVDYSHPRNATLPLSLRRRPAGDPAHRIGSLVINPGGPGEAGTQLLGRDLSVLGPAVRQRFDVVEMDPRGVGNSGGFRCNGTGSSDSGAGTGEKVDPVPTTPQAEAALVDADRGYADACAQSAGVLLGYIGTSDVARDLEQLRKALGEQELTFLGMSYGTLVGATYADLFPTRLRAMVLDGVINPSLPSFELWMAQAVGFQQQLDAFFASCGGRCAWQPGIPLPDALDRLVQRVRTQPLPAGGGATVGVSELYTALFSRLYSQSRWSTLASALGAAERGDGERDPRHHPQLPRRHARLHDQPRRVERDQLPRPSRRDRRLRVRSARGTGRDSQPALRSVLRVGRPHVRDVARPPDATAPPGHRAGFTSRARDRDDERPGDPLRVGPGGRVHPVARRAADARRHRSRRDPRQRLRRAAVERYLVDLATPAPGAVCR